MVKSQKKGYWGTRGGMFLAKDFNCALATLENFQDMIGKKEPVMLKAFTGLEGGLVGSGSTCGALTAGALGLALLHDNMLRDGGIVAEAEIMSQVCEYIKWFQKNLHSPRCQERTGVNFYTASGQMLYFLTGFKMARCMWLIRTATRNLYEYQNKSSPRLLKQDVTQHEPIHCAKVVLRGINNLTNLGDPLLERLSFVFDGGVGFQGGICGALAGAIMGINLSIGFNIRDNTIFQTMKEFAIGHINLIKRKPIGKPEPFGIGKNILQKFKEEAGAIDCSAISGKAFSGWNDFQEHITSSSKCKKLMELSIKEASNVIMSLK